VSLAVPTIHVDATPNTDQVCPARLGLVGPVGAIRDAIAQTHRGEPRLAASSSARSPARDRRIGRGSSARGSTRRSTRRRSDGGDRPNLL